MRKSRLLLLLPFAVLLSNCKKKDDINLLNSELKTLEIPYEGINSTPIGMAKTAKGNFVVLAQNTLSTTSNSYSFLDIVLTHEHQKVINRNNFIANAIELAGNIIPSKNVGSFTAILKPIMTPIASYTIYTGRNSNSFTSIYNKTSGSYSGIKKIIEVSDGFILLGNLNSKMSVQKLDNNYNVEWYKIYGENYLEMPIDIQELNDGSLAILSNIREGSGTISYNYRYRKVSSKGDSLFSKTLGQKGQSFAELIFSVNNMVYTVAQERYTNKPNCIVTCFDAVGEMLWQKSYGENVTIKKLAKSANGIVAVGAISINNQSDFYVMEMDTYGNKIWEKFYGENTADEVAIDIDLEDRIYSLLIAKKHLVLNKETILLVRNKIEN